MSDAWRFATIESFVKVPVTDATTLLRVTAVSSQAGDPADARPTLVSDDGFEVTSFAAIPAPADDSETLRAAYAVPTEMIKDETVFSLEFADFFVIALPMPTIGSGRADPSDSPAEAAPGVEEDRRGELQPKIAELSEELGESRHESFELRTAFETADDQLRAFRVAFAVTTAELEATQALTAHGNGGAPPAASGRDELVRSLRAQAAEAEAESRAATERVAELETWSAELERRLADTTTQLAGARASAPAPIDGGAASDPAALMQLRDAAIADAHQRAERDLADAGS